MKRILIISRMGMVCISVCKKSDIDMMAELKQQSQQEAFADEAFDEVYEIADQAFYANFSMVKGDENKHPRLAPCATISFDTTTVPRLLTIDFGPENCLCNDGKYRRGLIDVTFNGHWRRPGTVITHTFQNYYVNDNHVQGNKVLTNQGFINNYMTFKHVNNGSITFAQNGHTMSWQSEKMHTWIEGWATPRWRDDVFLVAGFSNASHSNGLNVFREILQPLRRELSCRYFVSGTVQITPDDGHQRLLDFGEGVCDNKATLTIGDQVFVITLP